MIVLGTMRFDSDHEGHMDHGLSGACTIRPLPLISDIAAAPDVQAQLPLIDLGQGEVAPADELPIGDPWSRQADIDRGPVQIGRAVQMQALTVDPHMVEKRGASAHGHGGLAAWLIADRARQIDYQAIADREGQATHIPGGCDGSA